MSEDTSRRPPDERCKCGKRLLQYWWEAITDAGIEGTDYKRHSRGECMTRTERDARRPKPKTSETCEGRWRTRDGVWRFCRFAPGHVGLCWDAYGVVPPALETERH